MAGAGVRGEGEGDVRNALLSVALAAQASLAVAAVATQEKAMALMTVHDLLALPRPVPDHRLAYGDGPLQFGELRLPPGDGPFPVAVLLHGGCWLAPYDLAHLSHLAAALAGEGVATWSVEYRRVGDAGGGFPGTFADVARGADVLRTLAVSYPLDLARVVLVGHSAGGHLALWLAGRPNLPRQSPLRAGQPLRPLGVVALAGIPDLVQAADLEVCGDAVARLVGGDPRTQPERVAAASPAELPPLGVPVTLVTSVHDQVVPGVMVESFARRLAEAGDSVSLRSVEGAGHYELVNPDSVAWPLVLGAIRELLGDASGRQPGPRGLGIMGGQGAAAMRRGGGGGDD